MSPYWCHPPLYDRHRPIESSPEKKDSHPIHMQYYTDDTVFDDKYLCDMEEWRDI